MSIIRKLIIFLISFPIKSIRCQYTPFPYSDNIQANVCTDGSNTALVEYFFNLIFTEFHNQPPICVCVQMCIDQPTYCYPNGCFKKVEIKKKQQPKVPASQIQVLQGDESQPMSFLVDSQSDFMENLLKNKFVEEPKPLNSNFESQKTNNNIVHRDPFKDRYQSIFKYKKTPKLHLRYNLREQVKHMKSDVIKIEKIDVSKTKWPPIANKHLLFDTPNVDNNWIRSNAYSASARDNSPHYQSKFFKRDLTKKFVSKENNIDEVVGKDNMAFSLDNLIENFIQNSFDSLSNDTETDLNENLNYKLENTPTTIEPISLPYKIKDSNVNSNFKQNNFTTTIEPITMPYKINILNGRKIKRIILNETSNVVSIKNANENLDINKNEEDTSNGMYKNVFNDMISSLSKHIEKNNNSSIEKMAQVLGNHVADSIPKNETTFGENKRDEMTTSLYPIFEDKEKIQENATISEKKLDGEVEIHKSDRRDARKKSHQRFSKKLQNSKTN